MTKLSHCINVLIFIESETGKYIAQCLDHDIVGSGHGIDEALESLCRVINGHVKFMMKEIKEVNINNILSNVPRAPKKYWEEFYNTKFTLSHIRNDLKINLAISHGQNEENKSLKKHKNIKVPRLPEYIQSLQELVWLFDADNDATIEISEKDIENIQKTITEYEQMQADREFSSKVIAKNIIEIDRLRSKFQQSSK